jgi:uncharacterized protein YjbI with pentapeptide repeats
MIDLTNEQKDYVSSNFNDLALSNKKIDSISFEDCTFKNCDFSEAEIMDCKFIDCQFLHCNLSIAKIKDCRFSEVVFEDSKVIGIDWTIVKWPNIPLFSPIKFFKCIINDSTFLGLSLNEIVIEECKAHEVDFREGSFCDANFTYTDFTNSLFSETNLEGSDFTEALNYQIDINRNNIKGAKFSRHEAVRLLEGLGIELVD